MLNIGRQRGGLVKKDLGNKMKILRSYCVDGEFLLEDHIYIVVGMDGRNVLNMSLASGPTIISCRGNAIMKFLQYVIR